MIPALFSALEALRPAFTRERTFVLVAALLTGLIFSGKYTTLTVVFLQLDWLLPGTIHRYWSLPKLLGRRSWHCQRLVVLFLGFLMERLPDGFILGDVTHTTTQGRRQQARHFRPNPHYRKHEQNQSKFLAGNSALSLAYVAREHTLSGVLQWVFGLGCMLLRPSRRAASEPAMLRRTMLQIAPRGMLVVYDRGGNDAQTINSFVRGSLRFITRLNANAAFYSDPDCRQRIDPWCYEQTLRRDNRKIYRHEMLCYRKKVRYQLKVVIEISYNRSKRRWGVSYYLSTDTSLSASEIVSVYQTRRQIESVHADSKLLCGFNSCRVHRAEAIEAYLSLSLLACGLLEFLRFSLRHAAQQHLGVSTLEILEQLRMHWYHPVQLTRGLTARFLEHQLRSDPETLSTFRTSFSRHLSASP